jgi:hypothetical protein
MITLEFDDLPLLVDGVWLAGTSFIGQVDIEYDSSGYPWIEEIRVAAAEAGKPDLVLARHATKHNAIDLFYLLKNSILEHMAAEIEQAGPREKLSYADEHRLGKRDFL